MRCADKGISAFPESENLFKWIGTINGPLDTVYTGHKYKLSLEFPNSYPYAPPVVKFLTPCFHPNVDGCGSICLDILKDKWTALYDVRTILLSIQSLLAEPNTQSPLNQQASYLWNNQPAYKKYLDEFYNKHKDSQFSDDCLNNVDFINLSCVCERLDGSGLDSLFRLLCYRVKIICRQSTKKIVYIKIKLFSI